MYTRSQLLFSLWWENMAGIFHGWITTENEFFEQVWFSVFIPSNYDKHKEEGKKSQNERKAIKNWMSTKICVIVGITFHWTGIKLWSTQKGNRYKHRILQHPTHSISQLCNKKLSGTFLSNSKLSCLIQSYWWKDLLNEK